MTLPTPEQIANTAGKRPDNLQIVFVNEVAVAKEAFRAVAKELRKIIFNDRIYKKDYDKLLEQLDGEKVKDPSKT